MPGTDGGLIRGLEGVVAATTRLCDLDGVNGRLAYQGYAIEDLARHASFEEVVWLLWHGELPRADELTGFRKELTETGRYPPRP
jgi:citrate synthase